MIALKTLKTALKVDYSTDDTELGRLLDSAIAFVESYLGYPLQQKYKTVYLQGWVRTFVGEVSSVEITYTDPDSNQQSMTDFWLDRSQGPGAYLEFLSYPSFKVGTQPVVTLLRGFTAMPADLQQAVIGIVGHWYQNVEAASPMTIQEVPFSAKAILDIHRRAGGVR